MVTTLRVSMITLLPAISISCFFAGIITFGCARPAIPSTMNRTPKIASELNFNAALLQRLLMLILALPCHLLFPSFLRLSKRLNNFAQVVRARFVALDVRILNTAVIIDGHGLVQRAVCDEQPDRLRGPLRRFDRLSNPVRRELPPVDRCDFHSRPDSCHVRRPAMNHVSDCAIFAYSQTN